ALVEVTRRAPRLRIPSSCRSEDTLAAEAAAKLSARLGQPTSGLAIRSPIASYTLDDEGSVIGTFETMLASLAVGGAVVPCLGCLKRRELEHDCSFDFWTLQHLVPAIGNPSRDRMARQSCGSDLGIGLEFLGIACAVANENCVSWHIFPLAGTSSREAQ